jgi:hypothetical protein
MSAILPISAITPLDCYTRIVVGPAFARHHRPVGYSGAARLIQVRLPASGRSRLTAPAN